MKDAKKVRVVKPMRINHHILEVGDEFEVLEVKEDIMGTFFRPKGAGVPKGCYWVLSDNVFEKVL